MTLKTLLLAGVSFAMLGGFMTSCDNDDEETDTITWTVDSIIADYTGDLYISLGTPVTFEEGTEIADQTISIIAGSEDGTVTLTITNFAFYGMTLGDIVLPDLPATYADGVCTLGAGEKQNLSFLDGAIEATADLDADNTYISGDSITVYVDVKWTNTDPTIPIYVVFQGTK